MVGDFNNKAKRGIIPRAINYIYDEMDQQIIHKMIGNISKK